MVKAVAVAHGQLGGPDRFEGIGYVVEVRVPRTFSNRAVAACFRGRPNVTPACDQGPTVDPRIGPAKTLAGRYPPLYYLLVSAPIRLFPTLVGVRLMRVISALICAAFLASALVSAQPLGRWATLGVVAAMTPMAFYLGGVVNPSGLEIATAICLWTSAASIARSGRVDGRLIARATLAFVVFANTRSLSVSFAAIAVGAPLLLATRDRVRELARSTAARAGAAAVVVGTMTGLAWVQLRGRVPDNPFAHPHFTFVAGLGRSWRIFAESVTSFGLFEVRDLAAILIWATLWAALLFVALREAAARDTVVLLGVLLAALLIPIFISMRHPSPILATWQGRHGLPLWVGVPIIAGVIAATNRPRSERIARPQVVAFAALVGYGQVSAFATAAHRYVVGRSGPFLYFLHPVWDGPLPPIVLLVSALAGSALLVWIICSPANQMPMSSDGVQTSVG